MNNKIKVAFDQIHAEDSLKTKTKTLIYEKIHSRDRQKHIKLIRFSMAIVCFLVVLAGIGGYFSYTMPVAAISIDINPSIELKINMYDKVIDVKGYNEDGIKLVEELKVQYMEYSEAINVVLENEEIISYLSTDNLLEITVASDSQKIKEKMQSCISANTSVSPENIYCYGNQEDIAAAHSAGLSFGKYRVFLELQEINPEITVEDIQGCTMRDIRNMIKSEESGGQDCGKRRGNGYHKKGDIS